MTPEEAVEAAIANQVLAGARPEWFDGFRATLLQLARDEITLADALEIALEVMDDDN